MTTPDSITCKRCKLRSYNPGDIEHKFCARCDRWHESPDDYELNAVGTAPRAPASVTHIQIGVMVEAVVEFLRADERTVLARAIDTNLEGMVQELKKYGGRSVDQVEWVRLLMHCSRVALGETEVEFQFTTKDRT